MNEVNTPPSHSEAIKRTPVGMEYLILQGTDLRNTDLSDAQQLLSSQLAGADLSGAVLPPHLQLDESLRLVENLSKNARNVFLSTIFACIYCWLTLATTSDMALIGNSASSELPIINTAIPIVGFYWIAPLLLLGLYFYLHLYLQRLWDALAELPAVFPDGSSLDKKIYPWLLSGLVRSHLKQLKQQLPRFSRLQVGLSILLAWWLVPITFVVFWIGYLPRHDGYGTTLHTALLLLVVYAGTRFYAGASDTLHRRQRQPLDWKTAYKNQRCCQQGIIVLGITLLLGGIAFSVIQAVPGDLRERVGISSFDPRVWVPSTLQWLGIKIYPELAEAQFSIKPDGWNKFKENVELIARVKGARLKEVNLAYVNAAGAFLVNADLRGANLAWADLSQADLRGARLDGANLQGANLLGAKILGASLRGADLRLVSFEGGRFHFNNYWRSFNDLREVNLANQNLRDAKFPTKNLTDATFQGAVLEDIDFRSSNLTGVNFQGVNLDNVNFERSNLTGATFQDAVLENVNFENANLTGANFQETNNAGNLYFGANLIRTNFTGAKGLARRMFIDFKNSKIPVNWIFAMFSDDTLGKVGLPSNHNKAMREKNLQAYDLSNFRFDDVDLNQFDFHGANLEGAEFSNIDLSGANLQGVNLKGVRFSNTDLSGADLQRVNLKGANLIEINFHGAYLQEADLEKALIMDVGFTQADLRHVNFKGASFLTSKFIDANLQGASFDGVSWQISNYVYNYIKADLRGVVGLTCDHLQNNRFDLDPASQLPEALKNCG